MSNCIFCKIVNKELPAELYYEDEEMVVFKDIKPASTFHFLVVPKEHITNVNSLEPKHRMLVEKMVECGKKTLIEKGGNVQDTRIGFHLPPFNSISHLHLHVMSPVSSMSFVGKLIFRPNSWWFSSVDNVLEKLCSKL